MIGKRTIAAGTLTLVVWLSLVPGVYPVEASFWQERECKDSGLRAVWCALRDSLVLHYGGGGLGTSTPPALKILETGYSTLTDLGKEEHGFGLYSYAIVTSHSKRSIAFLKEVFKSIPRVEATAAEKSRVNVFYIPLQKSKQSEFAASLDKNKEPTGERYSELFYDQQMARAILNRVCDAPVGAMRELCLSDLSDGPFIFTYAKPATTSESLQPPFLFVDLRLVHERAFPQFLSAFREQVKRDDVTDGQRIDTVKLRVLGILLTAADWITPVSKEVADIVHSALGKEPAK